MVGDFANAQDLVEIKEIKEGVIVLKSGELRQVIMVGGINFALRSEEDQNLILRSYQDFLNGLNFPLQIIIHSRKINIEKYLSILEERRNQETSGLLQDQISEYQEFVRNFIHDNAIMRKTFLVVIPFMPIALPSADSVFSALPFGKKKDVAKENADENLKFEEAKNQLSQRTSQVVDGLRVVGLEAAILNDEQLIELFYNFYNPETVEKTDVAQK